MPAKVLDWEKHIADRITNETVVDEGGCLVWQSGTQSDGYAVALIDDIVWLLHRYVYYKALPNDFQKISFIKDGVIVRHTCDNPPCINLEHLVAGTQSDNTTDAYNRHRKRQGVDHWWTKLDTDTVLKIRKEYLDDHTATHRSLAAKYHTSKSNIGAIISGLSWKRL